MSQSSHNKKNPHPLGKEPFRTSLTGLSPRPLPSANTERSFADIVAHSGEQVLSQVFPEDSQDQISLVDLELIDEPFVRQRWLYPAEKVAKMASSIMQEGDGDALKGQLQPVLLTPSKLQAGRFEMVEGFTRFLAFKDHHLGKQIKAIVRSDLSKEAAYRIGFKANEERHSLTDYDKGMSFRAAIDSGIYSTQENLASSLGLRKSAVSGYIAFGKLPKETLAVIEETPDVFSYNIAGRLAALFEKTQAEDLTTLAAKKMANQLWTYEKLSAYVADIETPKSVQKRPRKTSKPILDFGKIRYGQGSLKLELDALPDGLDQTLAEEIEALVMKYSQH